MPEVRGLELAASLPAPAPLIVFVTAFDQYAIRAFDASAIDYLLKPFDLARLRRALQRLRERLRAQPAGAALPAFDNGHPVRRCDGKALEIQLRMASIISLTLRPSLPLCGNDFPLRRTAVRDILTVI
jgi:DNA-binding LytR/AlgR family response regulator